jgi:glucan 1,3-beta-glucosidase
MVRVSRLLLNVAAACIFASPAFAFSPSFPYGSKKVRGVSLGGWLVLEVRRHFITLLVVR